MAPSYWDDEEEEYEAFGDQFDNDMDALKRACQLTGHADPVAGIEEVPEYEDEDDNEDDDSQFLQSIQNKLMLGSTHVRFPLVKSESEFDHKPLESDVEEDDADILQAIRNRFADPGLREKASTSYDNHDENIKDCKIEIFKDYSKFSTSVRDEFYPNDSGMRLLAHASEEEYDSSEAIIASENPQTTDGSVIGKSLNGSIDGDIIGPQPTNAVNVRKYAGIPDYARVLIEALKKNRLLQKTLQLKLVQVETKMEENKELRNRVKCLVDFQSACKRRLRQIFTQDSDSTVKLISRSKSRLSSKKPKETADNKVGYRCRGPPENEDVGKYRMALNSFPITIEIKKWSKKERENLGNGIKQQLQETLVRQSMEFLISQENMEDSTLLDDQISAVSQIEIKYEDIRFFLPQVDWERLASTYVAGHSGADCQARWLNNEDPLINRSPWTKEEDKKLLIIVQKKGLHNWVHNSNSLGTNRTPSQCLSRYQRSLNAYIMKKEWTEEEDEQLRAVIETYGENDWQIVAANIEGRTGAQCLNRWCKSIHPGRKKVGRWTVEEDKRLKLAVMVYGPKSWKKIASFVPGRTEVQCRERWCNVIDPSLKLDEWTEEEDTKLKEAVSLHGYCWAKVALSVPPRTDNQCRRRWTVLHPQELAAAQKAGKIRKAALISNFVGRKKERPTIGPSDFVPEQEGGSCSEANGDKGEKTCLRVQKRGQPSRTNDKNTEPRVTKRKKSCHTSRQEDYQKSSEEPTGQNKSQKGADKRVRRKRTKSVAAPKTCNLDIDDRRINEVGKFASLEDQAHGLASANNSGDRFQSVVGATGQIEEISSVLDQDGEAPFLSNSLDNKVKGKRMKLRDKARLVNQKTGHSEIVQYTTAVHMNSNGLASVEGAEAHLSCVKLGKRERAKRTKPLKKDRSVNQEHDHETMQCEIPSNGLFVASVEGAEAHASCGKLAKRARTKRNKPLQKNWFVTQEQHDHESMHLATPSVPEDESLQLAPDSSSYRNEIAVHKHGENETVSLINCNQDGGKVPVVSIKSNKRVRKKQYNSVKKGSDKMVPMSRKQNISAGKASHAKHKNDDQDVLQVVMPNANEQGNLDGMPIGVDGTEAWSHHVEPDKSVIVNQTESAPKFNHTGLGKDYQEKSQFEMIPCTVRTANDVSFEFASMVKQIADCCRHDRRQSEQILVLPAEKALNTCQGYNIGTRSSDDAIKPSAENRIEGYNSLDSCGLPDTEAGLRQDDEKTVALATKTILSWPFCFGLQDVLRNKLKGTKDHVNITEERPGNTCHLGGDDLRFGGLVSVKQEKSIEKLENSQKENKGFQLSNEDNTPKNDKMSLALADTETCIKEGINEKAEQENDVQPRRSRRANRTGVNYKELLKGNVWPSLQDFKKQGHRR